MAGAVDQHIHAAPAGHGLVDQFLQVVHRLVRAGHADAAQLGGQRLATAGGRQDADLEAIGRQTARGGGTHAAAGGGDQGYFAAHGNSLWISDLADRDAMPLQEPRLWQE